MSTDSIVSQMINWARKEFEPRAWLEDWPEPGQFVRPNSARILPHPPSSLLLPCLSVALLRSDALGVAPESVAAAAAVALVIAVVGSTPSMSSPSAVESLELIDRCVG